MSAPKQERLLPFNTRGFMERVFQGYFTMAWQPQPEGERTRYICDSLRKRLIQGQEFILIQDNRHVRVLNVYTEFETETRLRLWIFLQNSCKLRVYTINLGVWMLPLNSRKFRCWDVYADYNVSSITEQYKFGSTVSNTFRVQSWKAS